MIVLNNRSLLDKTSTFSRNKLFSLIKFDLNSDIIKNVKDYMTYTLENSHSR